MKEITTLNKNRDFNRAYGKGKSYVTPILVVYILKVRRKDVRLGITTSKKVGNAVERNRARRVIREAYRAVNSGLKRGYDIVLVARKKATQVKSGEVLQELKKVLREAKLLGQE